MIPIIIIGGVVTGTVTPAEAGMIAVVYIIVVLLPLMNRGHIRHLPHDFMEAAILYSLPMSAVAAASAVGWLLAYLGGPDIVRGWIEAVAGDNRIIIMYLMVIALTIAGDFLDGVPAIAIFMPIIVALIKLAHINPVHMGVLIIVSLAFGLITPPYGLILLLSSALAGVALAPPRPPPVRSPLRDLLPRHLAHHLLPQRRAVAAASGHRPSGCDDNSRGSIFPPHEGMHFPEETMDSMLERRTLLKLGAVAAATLGTGIDFAAAQEKPKRGGTLTIGRNHDADTLYPGRSTGLSAIATNLLIYDGLVLHDFQMKIRPALAERWEVSPDGLAWTFYLKKGVKFHCGAPLTAQDVKDHFDRWIDPKEKFPTRAKVTALAETRVVDDSTIVCRLKNPTLVFLNNISQTEWSYASIPHAKHVAQYGQDYGVVPASVCGSGPYKLKEWTEGRPHGAGPPRRLLVGLARLRQHRGAVGGPYRLPHPARGRGARGRAGDGRHRSRRRRARPSTSRASRGKASRSRRFPGCPPITSASTWRRMSSRTCACARRWPTP